MVSGEHRRDRGRRLARRFLQLVGEEFRAARLRAGLTQRQVGTAVGISHTEVSRIELGKAVRVPYETLVMLATVLGLDLPLRAYPSGEPIRDAAQVALLGRLRSRLHPDLRWRTEVPLRIPETEGRGMPPSAPTHGSCPSMRSRVCTMSRHVSGGPR
jgi:transcriptional regulator with XRE-family HTH domain